jgi:hypothetical protein
MPESTEPTPPDPLAERLRATVEHRTGELPAAPDLPGRIHARVRRRRRQRRALGSGLVAATLVAVLAGALVLIPDRDGADDVQTAAGGDRTSDETTTSEPDTTTTTAAAPTTPPDSGVDPTTPPTDEPPVTTATTLGTPPSGPVRVTPDTPLNYAGIGPIRAGMTVHEAERASGVTINPSASIPEPGGTCNVAQIEDYGIWLLLRVSGAEGEDQKAGVITVVESGRSTEEGIRLGDAVDRVTSVYGEPTRTAEYPYQEGGQMLIFERSGYAYNIVTDGAGVIEVQSGYADQLPVIEGGCV